RTKLVSTWLANNCDQICAACEKQCPNDFSSCKCYDKPAAKACHANPMLCPEMRYAHERKALDPKWKANHCDDVCVKIGRCAEADCSKASSCGEPMKMYQSCAVKTPGGAACGLRGIEGGILCPEPEPAP